MVCHCHYGMDAYFAVGPVFLMLKQVVGEQGQRLAHIVTRAKSNVVAYEDSPPRTGRRGAPWKYGKKISLTSLFNHKDLFQEVVPRDCVARNRGADFVECLVPAPCTGTRHSTGHRAPHMQAVLACTAPGAGQRRDYGDLPG